MRRLNRFGWAAVFLAATIPLSFAARAVAEEPRPDLIRVDVFRDGGKGKPAGVANCVNDDPAQYSGLYGLTGWALSGAVTAHLNLASVPPALSDATGAMQRSFDAWFLSAGVPRVAVAGDGTVAKATANRQDDVLFGRPGGSIATTYTWRWTDGLIESDVVFNKGLGWFQAAAEGDGCEETAGARYDWENIAVHEFGHVYGLDHPSDSRFETMHAYGYTGETLKRSPATGDGNGMRALYG
ncbi:MAG: matrixin family metalloprotease [Acidobacteria bacterium]|nr:matrixin family metalloprotease [Acidobacteriota bacterium]